MEEIKKIQINDKDYPSLLRKIQQPPRALYIKGEIPKGPCFAIVGTRRCSAYGKQIALEIAGDLTQAGFVIVSGMAKGIDTYSHKACLEASGKTIAVLGTGIDEKSIYPQENLKLAQEIVKNNGCIISEYSPGMPGYRANFPRRNRIISGLCLGVLVIEAKIRSGALITARWAKQQKRKVFAVPGSIHSLNSKGPHILIKKGAVLVENANDILKELQLKHLPLNGQAPYIQFIDKDPEKTLILKTLKQGPLHIEKIIEITNLPVQKILSILSIMEIKDQIRNLGNNVFALKR